MMTKNFNLQMFKNGKAVQTKLGNPVRFITVTSRNELIVAVGSKFASEEAKKYHIDGKLYVGTDSNYDLEMVDEYAA